MGLFDVNIKNIGAIRVMIDRLCKSLDTFSGALNNVADAGKEIAKTIREKKVV